MIAGMQSSLVRRKDGVVLAFTALVISVLIFVMALAVDSSIALSERSNMQAAADHAARSAALVLGNTGTDSQSTNTARAIAWVNGYRHSENANVTVTIPPSGYSDYDAAVEVVIEKTSSTFLASVFNVYEMKLRARAVGAWEFAPCIVALNTADAVSNSGVSVSGSPNFTAGCGIYSNSQHTTRSINSSGAAKLNASGCVIANNGGTTSIEPNLNCSVTLKAPTFSYALPASTVTTPPASLSECNANCRQNAQYLKVVGGKTYLRADIDYTRGFSEVPNPPNGVTWYLEPDTRYFMNTLKLGGGGTLASDPGFGNVIIFTGARADLQVTGGSYLDITAMDKDVSPMYAGIAIIGTSTLTTATITGGSGGLDDSGFEHPGINGIISIPSTNLTISGGSATSKSCQTYIANSVTVTGSDGGIGSGCPSKSVNLSTYRTKNLIE